MTNGERWEPCQQRGCNTEPVCNDCGHCDRHCTCAQQAREQAEVRAFSRQYPGFLEALERHREQGEQER